MMWCRSALLVVGIVSVLVPATAQEQPTPTVAQVRAALARGEAEAAWALISRMRVERETVNLAVELALTPAAPTVAPERLPWLADRTARLSIDSNATTHRLTACAVTTRLDGSVPCAEHLVEVTSGRSGTVLDRAHLWVVLTLLGASPQPLPAGWTQEVRGASALELATWSELPPVDRVRLLEPMLNAPDVGAQIAARATLQLVPGPEAAAVWRSLATPASGASTASFPGARTQILVGLARHGDVEALRILAPNESQLSASDRLVLAIGRAERGEAAGRAALMTMVLSGAEMDAVRAAEALATVGPDPRIESRVRAQIRDGGAPLRLRWLGVAARLKLGHTPEVVRYLADDAEDVRIAAALAVAVVARP